MRRTLTPFADLSQAKTNLSNRDRGDTTKQGTLYLSKIIRLFLVYLLYFGVTDTMTDFVETSKSRNAKRTYTAITNVADFEAAVQAFAADSTMGLTRKELSTETYKAQIRYFDAKSDEKGYVNLYAADKTQYESLVGFLASDLAAEAANGEDHGGASRDSTEDTWSARYSCAIGDDTFTVTITREYMLINGFENDETLAAVETWADSQPALGGESA